MKYFSIQKVVFILIVIFILAAMPVNGQNSQSIPKWDRVDYPYLDLFFIKLSHHTDYEGDLSVAPPFPIKTFHDYIKIEKLEISKDRKKYRAEIKYFSSTSLDTLNIKNYFFYDSVLYRYTPIYPEPEGKRIVKKIINDSIFIFPYYWENKFDLKKNRIDSLFKIKTNGNYICDNTNCYYCLV